MFVNQVLFRYENFTSIFIWLFGRLECCSLHFNRKIAKSLKKLSNTGLQKYTKIIKISGLFRNADVSKRFVKFQCFHKKITKSMFLPPKH